MTAWVVALLAAATIHAADIRVVGSDLLGVEFSRTLYEFAGRNGLKLALALDGSRPGLDQLKAGRADLALLTLPAEEESGAAEFTSLTVAYHVAVVLVPSTLPLERLTLDELSGIFGEGGPTNLSRWGELGLGGDWALGAIEPQAPTVGRGIAVEFFRHVVLHDRVFKSAVGRYATPAELLSRLAGASRAIALAPARPAGAANVKVVPVALHASDPAFSPAPENLHSGDYPLRLPLRLVFRRESATTMWLLLRFFFSDEFTPHLEGAGVVPLPAAARHQQVLALEKL
jgi:phosphate transport system substrate-binding protein